MNFQDYLAARSTIRTMAAPPVAPIPTGNETFVAKKGDVIISSGMGQFKAGLSFTVKETYTLCGYCYYTDTKGNTHRNKDIA